MLLWRLRSIKNLKVKRVETSQALTKQHTLMEYFALYVVGAQNFACSYANLCKLTSIRVKCGHLRNDLGLISYLKWIIRVCWPQCSRLEDKFLKHTKPGGVGKPSDCLVPWAWKLFVCHAQDAAVHIWNLQERGSVCMYCNKCARINGWLMSPLNVESRVSGHVPGQTPLYLLFLL